MWLINVETQKVVEFIGDSDVPKYAILSHTWGKEEVSFQEITDNSNSYEKKEGFRKIKFSCQQAKADGLDWVWVDTCCIDKKSSAELSEAINSMFRYYKNSTKCYAYLADVSTNDRNQFSSSRWFTRGWTLQELIAPPHLYFFTSDWLCLGNKVNLSRRVRRITNIDEYVLQETDALQSRSIAMKMSWAAKRQTTRIEDMAYSLLGIFDVNMPLLYGEGSRAFARLQEEILKVSNDQSLFAWGLWTGCSSHNLKAIMRSGKLYDFPLYGDRKPSSEVRYACRIIREYTTLQHRLQGLLAQSPKDFSDVAGVEPIRGWSSNLQEPAVVTGGEIRIKLPVLSSDEHLSFSVVILGCSLRDDKSQLVGIFIKEWNNNVVGRLPSLLSLDIASSDSSDVDLESFRALSSWLHFRAQKDSDLWDRTLVLTFALRDPFDVKSSKLPYYNLRAIHASGSLSVTFLEPGWGSLRCHMVMKRFHFGPLVELIYEVNVCTSEEPCFLAVSIGHFPGDSYGRSTQDILLRAREAKSIDDLLGSNAGLVLHHVSVSVDGWYSITPEHPANDESTSSSLKSANGDYDGGKDQPWVKELDLRELNQGDRGPKLQVTRKAVPETIGSLSEWRLQWYLRE